MKRTTLWLSILVVLLWLLGLWLFPPAFNARNYMHEVFYVTGVLAWLWMAVCLVIAARPKWIEKYCRESLDELYIFHKQLGYAAVALSFVHFFAKEIFRPMVNFFWTLPRPPKVVRPEDMDFFANLWGMLRKPANVSAEWLTWLMLILAILCLVKFLTYKRWLTIHSLFAWAFIGLTLHCIRLMDASDFYSPFGWMNILITIVGLWASVMILWKGPGWELNQKAKITLLEKKDGIFLLKAEAEKLVEAQPGQFFFLKVKGQDAHPFSAANISGKEAAFWIRPDGDFTGSLEKYCPVNTEVKIEGPWGKFVPSFSMAPQAWIAVGIGIAPFGEWLRATAQKKHGPVTLFWCIESREKDAWLLEEVTALCEKAGVALKLIDKSKGDPRLTAEQILALKPELAAVCGSEPLYQELKAASRTRKLQVMTEKFAWK